MFRQLVTMFSPGSADGLTRARMLFNIHPLQLHRYMEEAWSAAGLTPPGTSAAFLGNVNIRGIYGLNPHFTGPSGTLGSLIPPTAVSLPTFPGPVATSGGSAIAPPANLPWDHLIYAYLIENTRIVPIFRRVCDIFAHHELLEVPSDEARLWLRTTEELFNADAPRFHISSISSGLRPDAEAIRRNVYGRLLGMDLNHGRPDDQPYPFVRGTGSNKAFVEHWERFLGEVWQGYLNRKNSSGENSEDPEAVAQHAEALARMLQARRLGGNLAREEFTAVAMMSWLHLTVEFDTPIVETLKSTAPSPAERLRKIGDRVGVAAHPKSRNFFDMAEEASELLRAIELNAFNSSATVHVLYDDAPANPARSRALAVINNWSAATGRDVKLKRLRDAYRPPRPAPLPASARSGRTTAPTPVLARETYSTDGSG
ncbi:hypothetical protein [Nocardia abscessus]|uniref:hypothetical protein n=1 Tax=Nocardia abscessus TaxID=120957 RepID=UPI0024539351|nr:hypothetical protein [Nocardia abscessus]